MIAVYMYKVEYSINEDKYYGGNTNWRYGEVPEAEKVAHSSEDIEANKVCGFWIENGFFKRKYLRFEFSTHSERFSAENKYATLYTPVVVNRYSVKDLAEKLSANDFVDWCKDNGISEIKI